MVKNITIVIIITRSTLMINSHKQESLQRGNTFFPVQYSLCNTSDPLYNLPIHWHQTEIAALPLHRPPCGVQHADDRRNRPRGTLPCPRRRDGHAQQHPRQHVPTGERRSIGTAAQGARRATQQPAQRRADREAPAVAINPLAYCSPRAISHPRTAPPARSASSCACSRAWP